ncbi:MarR family winged helix-turn-helix transcriptional regulator [Gordonia sp. NPDC003424]
MPEPVEPRGPHASTGFWLHHAALAWRSRVDDALRDTDLTVTQFTLLASANFLSRDDMLPSQQEVAEFAGADRMMASKVVSALEKRGLVRRRSTDTDARAKLIEVTADGAQAVQRAVRAVARVDAEFFGDKREELRETLQQLGVRRDR